MWSVGVVITEMMLGRPLFPRIPSGDLQQQHNSHVCRLFYHLGPPHAQYFDQFPDSRAKRTLVEYAGKVTSCYLWDALNEGAAEHPQDPAWQTIIPLSKCVWMPACVALRLSASLWQHQLTPR